jgi:hypothetical protein
MIPGPPPVMIEKPASPSSLATSRARAYSGWSGGVRAEPKIDTALPMCERAANPSRSSSSMRSIRAASVRYVSMSSDSASSSSSSSDSARRNSGSECEVTGTG